MTDIAVNWDNTTGHADWLVANGDIAAGSDLESAVLVSIFTDRISTPDFIPYNGDRRGHFTDTFAAQPCGSNLWQLDRSKFSAATNLALQARDFVSAALRWMIDDGICDTIDVTAVRSGSTTLAIGITLTQPRVTPAVVFRFSYAWNALNT